MPKTKKKVGKGQFPSSDKISSSGFLFRLRLFLLYSFPVVLFCSYYPLIPIISTASTNYELSLPLIWLALFSVLSLKDYWVFLTNSIKNLYKNCSLKTAFPLIFLLFPLYLSLTILWSENLTRAILTSGIFWCLVISGTVAITTLRRSASFEKQILLKSFLFSSVAFSLICWLQSILDVIGIDRTHTLLCPGCTSYSFGFPHPSGFAIEPQFMGNLLLAPTFVSLYYWLKPTNDINRTKKQIEEASKAGNYITSRIKTHKYFILSFFLLSSLFLTFSRGAIYSFVFSLVVLLIIDLIKRTDLRAWRTLPLLACSFCLTLLAQGVFSAASYTNTTFLDGIEKSISQLSLGKIELNLSSDGNSFTDEPKGIVEPETSSDASVVIAPAFDGYVEESTNVRMVLNHIAVDLSTESSKSLAFGYGLGSAGEVMYQKGKTSSPAEIVQNEYLSMLLETGLLGLLFATVSFIIILIKLRLFPETERLLLGGIILSFLLSLMFFSGLPNALHIYLFPAFIAMFLLTKNLQKQPTA